MPFIQSHRYWHLLIYFFYIVSGVLDWFGGSSEAWAQRHQPEPRPDGTSDLRPEGSGGACAKDCAHTQYPAGTPTSGGHGSPIRRDRPHSCRCRSCSQPALPWRFEKCGGWGSTFVCGHVTPSGHVECTQWYDLWRGRSNVQISSWDFEWLWMTYNMISSWDFVWLWMTYDMSSTINTHVYIKIQCK